jgi:hypothetical protein
MSLSDFGGNVRSAPVISASSSEIPQSILSSNAPRPINSRVGLKQTLSSTASQNSSGTMLFQLGCGAGQGFLKSNSLYLYCTVGVTQGANTWYFNLSGDVQSIIQRCTLYLNGQICEQIQAYNKINQAMDNHCATAGYNQNDLFVLSGKGLVTANNATINVATPIKLGILNSQQDLPLFLFNTAQLEINLETVGQAILGITSAVTEYQVTNARLIYQVYYPDTEYENSMRAVLASGKLYQAPFKTWYNIVVNNAGSTVKNVPIGLNMSSVMGIFHFAQLNDTTTTNVKLATGDTPANFRVFADGQLLNSYNLDNVPMIFGEMKRALNCFGDPERSSVSATSTTLVPKNFASGEFSSNAFLGGLSLNKTFESGFAMSGSAVGQLLAEITNAGSANTNLYICTAYSQILTVDAMGNIALIR